MDAVSEDIANEPASKRRPTKRERLEAEELREQLRMVVDDREAALDRDAAEPDWKKRAKKKEPPDSGHVM
jgi:hypothetical protein